MGRTKKQCRQKPAQPPLGNFPGKPVSGQQMAPDRDQYLIWEGHLEWEERTSNPWRRWRQIPCQVLGNHKDGEPEINADYWPQKLRTYFSSEEWFEAIGEVYLKLDLKRATAYKVHLNPTACNALRDFTEIMSTGFVGSAFFTSSPSPAACDLTVMIFFYDAEEGAFNGFILNEQTAVVDYFLKVCQEHTEMVLQRHGQVSMVPSTETGGSREFYIWDREMIGKIFKHIANREKLRISESWDEKRLEVAGDPSAGIHSKQERAHLKQAVLDAEQEVIDGNFPREPVSGQQMAPERHQCIIWNGYLKWEEKVTSRREHWRWMPCHVLGNHKDGEPEINADSWPEDLHIWFSSEEWFEAIGKVYLKLDSKCTTAYKVRLNPTACNALRDFTEIMSTGFVGSAFFKSSPSPAACDLTVMILFYDAEEGAFNGFILNEQTAVVDYFLKVYQLEHTQVKRRQGKMDMVPSTGGSRRFYYSDTEMIGTILEHIANRERLPGTVPCTSEQADRPKPGIKEVVVLDPSSNYTLRLPPETSVIKIPVAVSTANNSPICPTKSQDDGARAKKRSSDNIIAVNVTEKRNSSEISQPCPPRDKTNCRGMNGNEGTGNGEKDANEEDSVVDTTKITPAQPGQRSKISESWDEKRLGVAGDSTAGIHSKQEQAHLKQAVLDAEQDVIDQTSNPQVEKLPGVDGCTSAVTNLESAKKINQPQVVESNKAGEAVEEATAQHSIGKGAPVEERSNNHMSSGLGIAAPAGQSVPSVPDLIKEQQKLSRSIVVPLNVIEDMCRSIWETRSEKLNLDWERYRNNHYLIECNARGIEKLHKYFEEDLYEDAEIKFQASRKHLEDLLGQMKADAGMPEWQEVRKNGFRVAWDGFLEWSPPMDEEDSQAQEPLRVHCQISVNVIDGKLEVNTDAWDRTLKVKFLSKLEIRNVRGSSTSVIVDRGPHEDRKEWASLQSAAARGMMPFTTVESPTGDTKTLVFEYLELIQKFVGHVYNGQYSSQQCPPGTAAGSLTQAGTPEKSTAEDGGPGTPAKDSPTCSKVQTPKSLDQGTRVEKRPSDEIDPMKVPNKRMNSDIIPAGKLTKTTVKGADARQPSMQQILKSVKKDEKFPKIAETSPREDNERQVRGLRRELRIEMAEGAREDATVQQLKEMRAQKIAVLQGRYDIACELKKNYEGTKKRRRVNKLAVKSDRGFKCRPRKTWY